MPFRPERNMRRPGFIRGRPRPFEAMLLNQLDHAHHFMAEGQPAQAAPIFANLAQQAEARAMPARAAQLHAQAGRGYAQNREGAPALQHTRAALQLFISLGMLPRAQHLYQRASEGLRQHGLTAEAQTLETEWQNKFGVMPNAAPPSAAPRPQLPTKCPACNGPIRSDEVDWIDEASAECPYCGGTLIA